jgi:hypothetical protein
MAPSLTHCVSRRYGRLSLKRCGDLVHPDHLILPVRGRPRTETLARISLTGGYAASAGRQRAVTEGPGKSSSGGVTIRPGR